MLRSERGASSVLVIFMMIILVVLGALALTTAQANLRLSRRTHDAYADMYMLDASAEAVTARVDERLAEAEDMARDYMEHGGYTLQAGGELGSGAQRAVYDAYMAAATDNTSRALYLETLFKRLYYYFAMETLYEMSDAGEISLKLDERYPKAEALVSPAVRAPDDTTLAVSLTVSFGNEPGARQLSGELAVVCPAYTVTPGQGVAAMERGEDAARMRLTAWRQWQAPFEYNEGFFFDSTLSDEGL